MQAAASPNRKNKHTGIYIYLKFVKLILDRVHIHLYLIGVQFFLTTFNVESCISSPVSTRDATRPTKEPGAGRHGRVTAGPPARLERLQKNESMVRSIFRKPSGAARAAVAIVAVMLVSFSWTLRYRKDDIGHRARIRARGVAPRMQLLTASCGQKFGSCGLRPGDHNRMLETIMEHPLWSDAKEKQAEKKASTFMELYRAAAISAFNGTHTFHWGDALKKFGQAKRRHLK